MNFLKLLLVPPAFLLSASIYGQSTNAPLNADYYHLTDRYEILSGSFSSFFHTSFKPLQRADIAAFADTLLDTNIGWNAVDQFNLQYLSNDNWEWSGSADNEGRRTLFNTFYRKQSDFFHVHEKDFDLHINPVLYLSAGKESAEDITTYTNTRGVRLRGLIANKLGFYSFVSTTQAIYPGYVRDWISANGVVPGEGFWKKFKEHGVDYFTAAGYLSFDLIDEYVNAQAGFDQFAIGDGHRSMILSDFAPGYTFLKLNTKIWRFQYTNLFAQGRANTFASGGGSTAVHYPKKFFASHHLSLNILDNLNVGFFETVIVGDSTERFDISYLNPVIFYRALEHQGGSQENVIIGMNAKWNFGGHFSLYGQFVLDEFLLSEVQAGNGWWANKYGGQVGLKYVNALGISNLDLQAEYNIARPYLHAHIDVFTNYAHYRQPMGHALGANFREVVTMARYQPWKRLSFTAQINYANYGADTLNANWGGDVMKSYTTRERDYGNEIGQGVGTVLLYGALDVTYQLSHNLFVDARVMHRRLDSELNAFDESTTWISGAVRLNIAKTVLDF
jgi:hypothetical protein